MTVQEVKHLFFTYRNGIVADSLRKAGDPHSVIFGLLLPQLGNIAQSIGKDAALAAELWNAVDSRESRLLAAMIYPPDEFDELQAREWLESCRNTEETDILCMKLIGSRDYAPKLAISMLDCGNTYPALRIVLNMLARGKDIYGMPEILDRINALDTAANTRSAALIHQIKHYHDC